MKGEKLVLLLPIGRLVQGSLYETNDKDYNGKPLAHKDGKSKVEYYIAVAVPKKGEHHWSHTEWGKKIHDFASKVFPDGHTSLPDFAWKIEDGDSQVPKLSKDGKTLKKPCDKEGYGGNWVVHLKTSYAPILCDEKGNPFLLPEGSVNPGDFIHVYCTVVRNTYDNTNKPGIIFNQTHIAFIAYGERISTVALVDPTTIGFGGELPTGASKTPVNSSFNPEPAIPVPPPAYPNILKPPKIMSTKANGIAYEEYVKQGWSDELLIQHGYMNA